jgi:hypothetical protein
LVRAQAHVQTTLLPHIPLAPRADPPTSTSPRTPTTRFQSQPAFPLGARAVRWMGARQSRCPIHPRKALSLLTLNTNNRTFKLHSARHHQPRRNLRVAGPRRASTNRRTALRGCALHSSRAVRKRRTLHP